LERSGALSFLNQNDAVEPVSWDRPFAEPIELPEGKKLVTLRDGALYITKLPKAEHEAAEWQAAMECLILVAEKNGPTMFARIGVMRALNPPRRVVGCKRTVVSRRHSPREGPYRTTTAIRPCKLWSPALQWCGGFACALYYIGPKVGGASPVWRLKSLASPPSP
jgi:hypothetical protein